MRERGIVHRASLTDILIFCNLLSPQLLPAVPPKRPSKDNAATAKLNRLDRFRPEGDDYSDLARGPFSTNTAHSSRTRRTDQFDPKATFKIAL
jgi:hypothetical protein